MKGTHKYLVHLEPEEKEFLDTMKLENNWSYLSTLREALQALAKQEGKTIKTWTKEIK